MAHTTDHAPTPDADVRRTKARRGISMLTRTHIELRKLVDTRASRSLLAVIGGLVVIVIGLLGVMDPDAVDLSRLTGEGSAPLVFLLPILGMLAIAGEWRHRTALSTYALDPARSRVLTAKLIAIGLLALAVLVATLLFSLLVLVVVGGPMPSPRETVEVFGSLVWAIGGMTLVGAGLGAALLNAPLALVVFFLLPQLLPQLLGAWEPTAHLAPYVDAHAAFLGGMAERPTEGIPAVISVVLLWIVIPMVVGYVRNARRDA